MVSLLSSMILQRLPVPDSLKARQQGEGGYLLATAALLIMAIGGLAAGYAFTTQQSNRQQVFYTLGQQFADMAVASHSVTQNLFYGATPTPVNSVEFFNATSLPEFADRFSGSYFGTSFQIHVIGVDAAPMDMMTPVAQKAASAFLILHPVRANGLEPPAADTLAFIKGAASHGMKGVGVYGSTMDANYACDGDVAVVRWGPADALDADKTCLSQLQIDTLFTAIGITIAPGDIIVPAWETAMARMDTRAVMRFPQPGRPDLTQMAVNLDAGGLTISNARGLKTTNMSNIQSVRFSDLTVTGNASSLYDANVAGNVDAKADLALRAAQTNMQDVTATTMMVTNAATTPNITAVNTTATNIQNAATLQPHTALGTMQINSNVTLTGNVSTDTATFGICDATTGACPL